MRRIIVLSMLVALFGGFFGSSVTTAQDAGALGPAIGEPSPIYSEDGSEIGTVTVNSIIEPFEEYEAGNAPQRGYHFALLDVTVTSTADRPFPVDPSSLRVVDSDGFVADTAFLFFAESGAPVFLEYLDGLAPGSEVTGAIAYEIFNDSIIERVVYSPSFNFQATVVDLRDEFTAAGTSISVVGSSGSEIAQVTVNGVADPFEGYDEFSSPTRGSRYVMIDVTIVNTGAQTLSTAPTDFAATDDQGFYLETSFVTPTDPGLVAFDYIDLAPGEQQQGVIYYQIFADIPLSQITYGDLFERDIVVADLALGAPAPATPVAQLTPDSTTAVASSADCESLVEWGNDLIDRINVASVLTQPFQDVEPEDLDPVEIRSAADQLAVLAQEQRDTIPPPAAEALNTFMADEFYEATSAAANQIADALETGDSVTALLALTEAEAISALFTEGAEADVLFEALEVACPAEFEILENQ